MQFGRFWIPHQWCEKFCGDHPDDQTRIVQESLDPARDRFWWSQRDGQQYTTANEWIGILESPVHEIECRAIEPATQFRERRGPGD